MSLVCQLCGLVRSGGEGMWPVQTLTWQVGHHGARQPLWRADWQEVSVEERLLSLHFHQCLRIGMSTRGHNAEP